MALLGELLLENGQEDRAFDIEKYINPKKNSVGFFDKNAQMSLIIFVRLNAKIFEGKFIIIL